MGLEPIGKLFLVLGALFLGCGAFMLWGPKTGLGKLPGDIYIKKEGFTLYFPWVTCLVLSILFTVISYFIGGRK